jgi:serine/threonine protein kinase
MSELPSLENYRMLSKVGGNLVALSDFWLACPQRCRMTDGIGTHLYRAPEQLLGSIASGTPVDIWAVGCLLYYIAMDNTLFPGQSEFELFAEMCRVMGTPDLQSDRICGFF